MAPDPLRWAGKGAGLAGGGGGSKGRGKKKGHTMYRSSWRNCTDDAKMGGTCLEKKKTKPTSRAYVSIFTTPPGRQTLKRGI